jgi:hypothetical protein
MLFPAGRKCLPDIQAVNRKRISEQDNIGKEYWGRTISYDETK